MAKKKNKAALKYLLNILWHDKGVESGLNTRTKSADERNITDVLDKARKKKTELCSYRKLNTPAAVTYKDRIACYLHCDGECQNIIHFKDVLRTGFVSRTVS